MFIYNLTPQELEAAQLHAEESVEHFSRERANGSGMYNHNKVDGALVGVKCEIATYRLLQHLGVRDLKLNFLDYKARGLKGDIQTPSETIEVKGLRSHQWDKFKRMVPPRNLEYYVRDGYILIWGVADPKGSRVEIKGWNFAYEVDEFGIDVKTIVDNVWLQDDSKMRDIKTLGEHLESPPPS